MLSDIKDGINTIVTKLTDISKWATKYISPMYKDIHTIRGFIDTLSSYYYKNYFSNTSSGTIINSIPQGWESFWSTFEKKSFSEVLKETLLEVQKEIDNQVNPLSDDNKESYTAAVDNLKKTTFVGSAYDVVETFPKKLNEAFNADSRSVLQFTTAGTKNSYFSLPARTYSIDFSWYKPFKPTADVVISAFIYLGFAIAFFKRLPEIIQGAGVVYTGQVNFNESRLYEQVNDTMANNYYDYLVNNGGIDDFDNFS